MSLAGVASPPGPRCAAGTSTAGRRCSSPPPVRGVRGWAGRRGFAAAQVACSFAVQTGHRCGVSTGRQSVGEAVAVAAAPSHRHVINCL